MIRRELPADRGAPGTTCPRTTPPNAACAPSPSGGRTTSSWAPRRAAKAGGKAAAIAYTLIETAKLNTVDPLAWLAATIARIPDYKITKVDDLLP